MTDFVNYLLVEMKAGRLKKDDVLKLLLQHPHGLAGDEQVTVASMSIAAPASSVRPPQKISFAPLGSGALGGK